MVSENKFGMFTAYDQAISLYTYLVEILPVNRYVYNKFISTKIHFVP